jgi:phosphonopyruvate decarboxylase
MIDCSAFYHMLTDRGVDLFTGVPDSLLKNICAHITDHSRGDQHVITVNEGGAIALACGHYLATGRPALVYMQNSGQGNAINPLASLADPDVYGIPMLLLIGWRGEPGVKDEPQHVKQGKITQALLDTLGISWRAVPEDEAEMETCLDELLNLSERQSAPVALIARKGSFSPYKLESRSEQPFPMTREEAITEIVQQLDDQGIVVSTTGKTSRELYECRESLGGNHGRDFLTVGSMGHASLIAMGIAMRKKSRQVFCLDGDGAALMHMGALATIGTHKLENFKHIILNNGAHDSVGGQPTVGLDISFCEIAQACGYRSTWSVETNDALSEAMQALKATDGPALLEIRIKKGARTDLGRPKSAPCENKKRFMEFLR